MSSTIIMLPLCGQPYIINDNHKGADDASIEELQEAVGGYIGVVSQPRDRVVIHPMFQENPAWKQVSKLIQKARKDAISVYCNDEGLRKCSPNMAVLIKHWKEGYIPLMGNIVIRVKNSWFNKNKKNYTEIHDDEEAMLIACGYKE